jgi:hypothetical protein
MSPRQPVPVTSRAAQSAACGSIRLEAPARPPFWREEIDGDFFTIETDEPHVKVAWRTTALRELDGSE